MLILFFKGLLIGLLLALPIGPTMVLCIRYSLAFGALMGMIAGLGAAAADALYGVVAGYGLWVVSDFMEQYASYFHIIGSALLCYLGVKTFMQNISPLDLGIGFRTPGGLKIFMTTFLLTVTSPLTLVGVSAFCAAFGVAEERGTFLSPWLLGLGIFLGSYVFWQLLSIMLSCIRKTMSEQGSILVGKVSGVLLGLLGIGVFVYSFFLK